MALTINSQPSSPESAYNDNIYALETDETPGTFEKVKATLTYDSTDYIFYAKEIGGEFTFNFSNILKSFIISKDSQMTSEIEQDLYSIQYDVSFVEVMTSPDTAVTASNKEVTFNIETRGSLTTSEITSPASLYPHLTNLDNKIIHTGCTLYFSWVIADSSENVYGIMERFFDDGTSADSALTSSFAATVDRLVTIEPSTSDMANIFSTTPDKTLYVDFWLADVATSTQRSDKLRLYVVHGCDSDINIFWLNDYNAIESQGFAIKPIEGLDRDVSGYLSDNEYYNSLLTSKEILELETFEETNETLLWLKGIWNARAVWYEIDGTHYPVEVVNDYSVNYSDKKLRLQIKLPQQNYV